MRLYATIMEKTGKEWRRVDFPTLRIGSIIKVWGRGGRRKVVTPPKVYPKVWGMNCERNLSVRTVRG